MDPTTARKRPKNIVGDANQGQKIMGTGLNGTPTANPGLSDAQRKTKKPGQGSRGITDTGTRNTGNQNNPTRGSNTPTISHGRNRGTTDTGTGSGSGGGNNGGNSGSNTRTVLRKAFNEKKSNTKGKSAGAVVTSKNGTTNKKGVGGNAKKTNKNKKKGG